MENLDLDLDFEKICRVCLEEDTAMSLFTANMHKKLMFFASIDIRPNDGLPSRVCNKCLANVYMCFKFKKLCQKNDEKLRRTHAAKKSITNEQVVQNTPEIVYVDCTTNDSIALNEDAPTLMDYENTSEPPLDTDALDDEVEFTESKVSSEELNVNDENIQNQCSSSSSENSVKIVNETHKCSTCQKEFTNGRSLKIHMRVHESIKSKECSTCHKKVSERSYKAHLQTHFENKPFKCDFCNRRFVLKQHMDAHMKVHNKDRNGSNTSKTSVCPICDKVFPSNNQLMLHCVIHAEDKPYGCDNCDKRFSTTNNLEKHKKAAHST